MTDPTLPNPATPSASTAAGLVIGAPLAAIVAWSLKAFAHVDMPAEIASALGALIAAVVGYFPAGGNAGTVQK